LPAPVDRGIDVTRAIGTTAHAMPLGSGHVASEVEGQSIPGPAGGPPRPDQGGRENQTKSFGLGVNGAARQD